MADVFDSAKRSAVMARIRSSGNKDTELKLASIFRTFGITGWRRRQTLFGRPDFVFRHERVVVFVDGCFWHGCPIHGRKPASNKDYWLPKLVRNKSRDRAVARYLRNAGWTVVRFWEHDLKHPQKIVSRYRRAVMRACELRQSALQSRP